MIRSRAAAALAVALVAVLPTAGCYQGFDETVTSQPPSGEGTDFTVGDDAQINVQDAMLVADPADPTRAALVMTIVNGSETDDQLTAVEVAGATGSLAAPVDVASGDAVKVGGPGTDTTVVLTGLTDEPGSFADLTVQFASAGSATKAVIVVLAEGHFADYAPAASTAP